MNFLFLFYQSTVLSSRVVDGQRELTCSRS